MSSAYLVSRLADTLASWDEVERAVDDLRREVIIRALEKTGGAKTKAAIELQMPFRVLRYRIRAHDIALVRAALIE